MEGYNQEADVTDRNICAKWGLEVSTWETSPNGLSDTGRPNGNGQEKTG